MEKVNIWKIEGMEFPAGRRTRVLIGQNGAIMGEHFCQGYVVIYKEGGIPSHEHETVESYTIIKGSGCMEVDGETQPVTAGDCIYIPPNANHALYNTGDEELHMMFVYSPSVIVDHWKQEMGGAMKLNRGAPTVIR